MNNDKDLKFTTNIYPDQNNFLDFKELWQYRDLIYLFAKRDWTARYKQTILGPTWALLLPVISTIVYTIVFGDIAGLAPNGIPKFLFFLSGNILWLYFSSSLSDVAYTFIMNRDLLSKVYFPRIIIPIYYVLTNLISLVIQFIIFLIVYFYYKLNGFSLEFNIMTILILPLIILQLAILALGVGMLLASLTAKFYDLLMLFDFGISFWLYLTPIVYDLDLVPKQLFNLYMLNPVTYPIAIIRNAFFSKPLPSPIYGLISVLITLILFVVGLHVFSKTEKNFIDTI